VITTFIGPQGRKFGWFFGRLIFDLFSSIGQSLVLYHDVINSKSDNDDDTAVQVFCLLMIVFGWLLYKYFIFFETVSSSQNCFTLVAIFLLEIMPAL